MPAMGHLRVLTSLIAPDALLPLLEEAYSLEEPLQCRLACSNDNDHYLVTAGSTKQPRVVSYQILPVRPGGARLSS